MTSKRTIEQIIGARESMDAVTFAHYISGGDVLYNVGGHWQDSAVNCNSIPRSDFSYKIKKKPIKIPCLIFDSGSTRVHIGCLKSSATHYIVLDDGEPRIEKA